MNKRKILINSILFVILLIFFFRLGYYSYYSFGNDSLFKNDYYKKEVFKTGNGDTYLKKMYYYEDILEDNSKKYEIGKSNVSKFKSNVDNIISKLKVDGDEIDFNADVVTDDDLGIIKKGINYIQIEYYDVDECVLYELYTSKQSLKQLMIGFGKF